MTDPTITIELTPIEQQVLGSGLGEWGGPVSPNPALVTLLECADAADFHARTDRLRQAISSGAGLTAEDWYWALDCTEIAFVSDGLGVGVEWQTCTGLDDVETLQALRGLQRRLPRLLRPAELPSRMPDGGPDHPQQG
ncbi:hypothetical protein [Arsenicicoccus dermatophilus]|uniref:hypothetical protein n=1 Tax=Arsenicicoccus dermatophilus TaxID=1076331 RepID=UPI001F4C5B47|nr:hypothetical protein [Arsenicicoccus dermatophilus]MCH8614223.1 hypothetical protein [Arsenicicoccus dermatophilus]